MFSVVRRHQVAWTLPVTVTLPVVLKSFRFALSIRSLPTSLIGTERTVRSSSEVFTRLGRKFLRLSTWSHPTSVFSFDGSRGVGCHAKGLNRSSPKIIFMS